MAELIPITGGGTSGQPVLEGDVLPPERKSGVVLQPHPFSAAHMRYEVAEGSTIYAIVLASGIRPRLMKHVRVWIGDEEIIQGVWHLVRPKAGTHIYIKLTPAGGSLGGSNTVRMMLMLAIVVAATAVAGPLGTMLAGAGLGAVMGGIAASLIVTGVSMLGMYLVNMLIPPPSNTTKSSERAFLGALRNRFNPFGPVPRIFGRRRVFPVMAGHPYTESSNGKRYLRAMLLVGFGPLKISDIKIGETSIESFDNITIEVREGWYDETYGKFRLIPGRRWEFDTTSEGWAGTAATLSVVNGNLRVTSTGADPQIAVTGLAVNGQRDYVVRAKVRRTAGTAWDGSLLYSTAGHGFSTSFRKTISNPFDRNDEWIICEWDMSALTAGGSDWRNNTITGLRLELGAASGTIHEVAWIEVGYPCGRDADRALYTKSISQLDVGAKLESGVSNIRLTEPDSIGFGVDVNIPTGLGEVDFNNAGDIDSQSVTIEVRYRKLGDTNWTAVNWSSNIAADGTSTDGQITYNAKSRAEIQLGGWALFPQKGQYEVRLVRTTVDYTGSAKFFGDTYWQSLRSYKDSSAINDDLVGGLTIISVRAKATDQFTSFPDQINCIAESYLPVRNSEGGFTYDLSRNPAWAFTDILRHRGRERLIADNRINLGTIRDWAVACDANAPSSTKPYWTVDAQIEDGSLFDACREIASHARASFIVENGLYSVVRDVPQTVPVQLITPKNSWGYNGMKQFIDLPHALRINFTNADKNHQPDEYIVYGDGYSKANASRFETLDFPYCTDAEQAFREGRYHMAVGQLRPEQHRVTMDIENLRCTLGDYVMLSHDVLSIGSGTGRVTAIVGTTTITGISLDEAIPMDPARTYGVRYRRGPTGSIHTAQLAAVTVPGEFSDFTFSTGIAAASAPLVGDLVMVGEFGVESAPMIVKRIEPGPDMTATLTLLDAQPGVWSADQASIPPFSSYITTPPNIAQQRPAAPTFRLVSDEQALVRQSDGSLPDQIMVVITLPQASLVSISGFEMQWRRSPDTSQADWETTIRTPVGKNTLYIPGVRMGRNYDVRVRSVSELGITSAWVEVLNHTVIGKASPPAGVTGLTVVAGIDGVQLSWLPNSEPDLKGYIVKRGLNWETAELVSEVLASTSIFVQCDTSVEQNFLVRAVDIVGNTSTSNAQITSEVIVPRPVTGLEGFLQLDVVFLRWVPVSMVGVRYEVRQGVDWKTALLVGVVSNSEIRTRLPSINEVDRVFWVEAVSAMGVYSGTPQPVTVTILPVANTNVVLSKDLVALSFPGLKHDATSSGSTLSLDLDGSGTQRPRADYYHLIDLGAVYSARSWVDFEAASIVGSGVTWDTANFSWASATSRSWLGTVSENRAGDVTPRIAIDSGFDASLVEGWRWNGTANGAKLSTAPTVSTAMTFASPARFENGALFERQSKLSYAVSVPSSFSIAIDARMRAGVNDGLLFKLIGSGRTLWCVQSQTEGSIALIDNLGNLNIVPYTKSDDDVATIVITQSATHRGLYVSSRRIEAIASDIKSIAAPGTFTSIAFYE